MAAISSSLAARRRVKVSMSSVTRVPPGQQNPCEIGQPAMLKGLDRTDIFTHQLARLFEVETYDQPIHDHVSLVLSKLGECLGDLIESKVLIERVEGVDAESGRDLGNAKLGTLVLEPKPVGDLRVRNLEQPSKELALRAATKASD